MDELTRQLAANLKRIRRDSHRSLDDLALLTGVSKSMLRQIEKGDSSPSISTVWKLANGLKTSFTSLFEKHTEPVSIVGFTEPEALSDRDSGYRLYPLFPFEEAKKFEIYHIEVDYGASLDSAGHAPGVEEYLFVLSGCLRITVHGDELAIEAGRAIHFGASAPHAYANRDEARVSATMILFYGSRGRDA